MFFSSRRHFLFIFRVLFIFFFMSKVDDNEMKIQLKKYIFVVDLGGLGFWLGGFGWGMLCWSERVKVNNIVLMLSLRVYYYFWSHSLYFTSYLNLTLYILYHIYHVCMIDHTCLTFGVDGHWMPFLESTFRAESIPHVHFRF